MCVMTALERTPLEGLPPLNQLRVFEATARLLSFTQAGRELHLTQSAVSQQIKSLEQHLGRALFVRSSRSIDLTEAGRAYLPIVRRTLDSLAAGTQTVFGRPDEHRLTVQVSLSFAVFWLAPRLASFTQQHADISVELFTVLTEPERTADVADLEIRLAEHADGGLFLRRTRYLPVCRADRDEDADWRTDTLLDCTAMRHGWQTWLDEQGETLPVSQRIHAANTHTVGLSALEHGNTLAMTLDVFAEAGLEKGTLAQPFEHVTETPEAYWLLEPQPGRRSPATDAFRSWLLEQAIEGRPAPA